MTNLPTKTQDHVSTLTREISALTDRLAPVSKEGVVRSVQAMQSAGMTLPSGIALDKLPDIYGYALDGVPTCGLAVATQKLIKGDYAGNPDVLLGMIPKPPVLAALAKLEARAAREDLARKREVIATINHKPEIDRSAEVMARVRAVAGGFKQAYEANRAKGVGVAPHQPMSADQAAYQARILALNDCPYGVTPEQAAYRRSIEAQVSEVSVEEPSHVE